MCALTHVCVFTTKTSSSVSGSNHLVQPALLSALPYDVIFLNVGLGLSVGFRGFS